MASYALLNQVIAGHRVDGFLDRGGTSLVFHARHQETGQLVAIKVLRDRLLRRADLADRFAAAAASTAEVDHPAVVKIRDHGRLVSGTPYQVMELLDGLTLKNWRPRGGTLPPQVLLPLLQQIAEGIGAAHAAGVVHRHLKPQNLFVLAGEPLRIKLMNLGMISAQRLAWPEGALPEGVEFLAPEERDPGADAHADVRSDVYGFGALTYWLVSGQQPLGGDARRDSKASRLRQAPPPLVDRYEEVRGALSDLLGRCLAREPDQRPPSMAEVIDDMIEAVRFATVAGVSDLARRLEAVGEEEVLPPPPQAADPAKWAPAPGVSAGAYVSLGEASKDRLQEAGAELDALAKDAPIPAPPAAPPVPPPAPDPHCSPQPSPSDDSGRTMGELVTLDSLLNAGHLIYTSPHVKHAEAGKRPPPPTPRLMAEEDDRSTVKELRTLEGRLSEEPLDLEAETQPEVATLDKGLAAEQSARQTLLDLTTLEPPGPEDDAPTVPELQTLGEDGQEAVVDEDAETVALLPTLDSLTEDDQETRPAVPLLPSRDDD